MKPGLIGNKNARRVLTDDQVRAIRRDHARKQREIAALNAAYSAQAMAERYGVHVRTVEKALRYETHRSIDEWK